MSQWIADCAECEQSTRELQRLIGRASRFLAEGRTASASAECARAQRKLSEIERLANGALKLHVTAGESGQERAARGDTRRRLLQQLAGAAQLLAEVAARLPPGEQRKALESARERDVGTPGRDTRRDAGTPVRDANVRDANVRDANGAVDAPQGALESSGARAVDLELGPTAIDAEISERTAAAYRQVEADAETIREVYLKLNAQAQEQGMLLETLEDHLVDGATAVEGAAGEVRRSHELAKALVKRKAVLWLIAALTGCTTLYAWS